MKPATSMKLVALALCASLGAAPSIAAAEDIDIFTGASGGSAIRPRILIVLDNTSNWARSNQQWPGGVPQGQSEASAIRTVLGTLDAGVNLGLMEFVTDGTASEDGGYIRSAIKQMTDVNRASLSARLTTIYNDVNGVHEKRNSNAPYGNLMYDVYNYFAGAASFSPAAVNAERADPDGYTTRYTQFGSPISTDSQCGKTFIIFIGNPNSSGPSADTAANTAALAGLGGVTTQIRLPNLTNAGVLTGTSSTDTGPRNADEWARFMFGKGIPVSGSTIKPSVTTYTIDVYNAQPNATQTSLLMSMATAGGGKYFAARSEQAIVDALKQILIEIQAINSSFASTSLPVNATNRSQNANQVFIGMFRPDPVAKPRWFGNLKRYQLINSTSGIELGDANGAVAINTNTGFLTPCATSYWTRDSGAYWSNIGVNPNPAGTCADLAGLSPYSDAPDGPLVEKGGVAQVLREGNVGSGTATHAVNRTTYTESEGALTAFNSTSSGLSSDLVNFIRGEDVNNEKNAGALTNARPSIHGDVIHSRPLPINYGDDLGVTVYYGANDGTFRAVNAATGQERWSFIAPEFFSRLARLKGNSPLMNYPNVDPATVPTPTPKDYFFDGSIGVYQNAEIDNANTKVWIFPSMRRGGRMLYAFDVSTPATPSLKWKKGCPNLTDDIGCTDGMEGIGQTWSTPAVAFIKGNSTTVPVVVVGGGYDACEDANSTTPSCASTKGGFIYILDASTGERIASFATTRAVAADIALVDTDHDGYPDYAYGADTGGNLYRVNFVDAAGIAQVPTDWSSRRIAYTNGGFRKFLFAPALLAAQNKVYIAIGSGDREHPLQSQYPYSNVTNRFYVYKDDLSNTARNLDTLENYSAVTSCTTPKVLPDSNLNGWYMDLLTGEQVVTSALIASGMVTFSTNQPVVASSGTCSTPLGTARGYWVNLFNASGAIEVAGSCGGARSAFFVGGGMPPSPVLASGVPIDGKPETVVIGAIKKQGGASVAISPQKIRPTISSRRKRSYTYTSGN